MTNTKELELCIKNSGMSYKYIAKRMGISYYCLRQKMNNVVEFKSSEIDRLCSILGIEDFNQIKMLFFAR